MNSYHVTPHPQGGWQVKRSNSQRASLRTDTQREAIDFARIISQNKNAELFIHGANGRIREKDSYGHDPFPPRG